MLPEESVLQEPKTTIPLGPNEFEGLSETAGLSESADLSDAAVQRDPAGVLAQLLDAAAATDSLATNCASSDSFFFTELPDVNPIAPSGLNDVPTGSGGAPRGSSDVPSAASNPAGSLPPGGTPVIEAADLDPYAWEPSLVASPQSTRPSVASFVPPEVVVSDAEAQSEVAPGAAQALASTRPDEDEFEGVSFDDPTLEQSNLVGVNVVLERLGGTIIQEIENEERAD